MAVPAAGARAAVASVQAQQVLQQAPAELQHRGADRQLHRLQPAPGGQRAGRLGGQPSYLGRRLRREPGGELIAEPFFCPS